jgi:hypothetical protein
LAGGAEKASSRIYATSYGHCPVACYIPLPKAVRTDYAYKPSAYSFGQMKLRTIILGVIIVVASFVGATLLMNLLWPSPLQQGRPQLTAMPPLDPLTGTSTVLAPATVAMSAIQAALEAQAPHNFTGKPQNPFSQLLPNADLDFNIARGPLEVSGRPDALVVSTQLSGTFEARGQLGGSAGALSNALGGMIGGNIGTQMQSLAGKNFDQRADIHGAVAATARPTIAANWRLAPNLSASANIADVVLPIAGVKLSVAGEVKPVVDGLLRDQTNAFEARMRNDPFIEIAARGEWAKLCRAIALGAAAPGMPNLWLEIRPVRAIAAQPKIDAKAVTLLVGVQAQTRIVPNETKPDCPFPAQLDIVPQADEGTLDIAIPVDISFTDVGRLIDLQVAGKTFPEDGSGSFATTIKQTAVAASGDRMLISLLVNVKKRGLFSLGADATVHVWGKPVLDQNAQVLRFTDVAVDVQSGAAFGLLGEAAQAAVPYLQKTLAEQAVIDLKPFAADAKKRIAAAAGAMTDQASGVTASIVVNDLRLTGIAYDDKTLRIIGDAKGTVGVAISSLAWGSQ